MEDNIRSVINRLMFKLLNDESCINSSTNKKNPVPMFIITWNRTDLHGLLLLVLFNHLFPAMHNSGSVKPKKPNGV